MEIKPTYVTFEQAKLLKEKGFKSKSRYYDGSGELVKVPDIPENDYRHTNNFAQRFRYEAPEQWQVLEWLRVEKGIWVHVYYLTDRNCWCWDCYKYLEDGLLNEPGFSFNMNLKSPQEAYSAAFDYILKKYFR